MSEMIRKNEPFMVQQDYQDLIRQVGCDLEAGRMQVISAVNSAMVRTYWMIGQHIVEYEQKGHEKADYGSGLLDQLSEDLSRQYGNGFGRSNVFCMRRFYLLYPKSRQCPDFCPGAIMSSFSRLMIRRNGHFTKGKRKQAGGVSGN